MSRRSRLIQTSRWPTLDSHQHARKFIIITSRSTRGNQKRSPKPSWHYVCSQISPKPLWLWGNVIIGSTKIMSALSQSLQRQRNCLQATQKLGASLRRLNAARADGRSLSKNTRGFKRLIRKIRIPFANSSLPTPRSVGGRKRRVGQHKCEQWRPLHSSRKFKADTSIFAGRAIRAR